VTPIERGSGVSLWRQIEQALEREIAGYPADQPFPTEAQLSRRFGVNRHTVRRAVAGLVQRGLLRVEQGRGTFVADHAIDYVVGTRTRFSENLLRQGVQPGRAFTRIEEVPASPEIAASLQLEPGAPVLELESVGTADGRPVSFSLTRLALERLPGIRDALGRKASITAALAESGIADYRRRSTRVIARPATEDERQVLRLLPHRPVLVTESIDVDARGRPILFGTARFAADRVQLVLETPDEMKA
jgi:GntR family phosphonate transport system transcriptional regulator